MIGVDGVLKQNAFPADDLVERGGRSVSLDRCSLLGDQAHRLLERKAAEIADAEKNRAKCAYALAVVRRVWKIRDDEGKQIYQIFPDPIEKGEERPWNYAHAKLVRADPSITKAKVRLYRDKLIELFSERIAYFESS